MRLESWLICREKQPRGLEICRFKPASAAVGTKQSCGAGPLGLRTYQNIRQVVHAVVLPVLPCLPVDREGVVIVFRILFLYETGSRICEEVTTQRQSAASCGRQCTAQRWSDGKGQLPSPTLSRPSLIHAVLKARRGQEDQGMKELRPVMAGKHQARGDSPATRPSLHRQIVCRNVCAGVA